MTDGPDQRREELRADCGMCVALCCVVPAFKVSADFALNKPARQPCPNLRADFRCSIHDRLRPAGFSGCAAFDCFGAGQKVTQHTFGGADWRSDPELAEPMFAAFRVMHALHELLWYLNEALALPLAEPFYDKLNDLFAATRLITNSGHEELVAFDVNEHRRRANAVLLRVSAHVRRRAGRVGADHRGADLAGKNLRDADLAGASLRGALMIGADLRGADLSYADMTGADLRGANLAGTDLESSLFSSQQQVDSARGDARTRLPSRLKRPPHWATAGSNIV
ncbi:MAG: pentapeptide repeat-containing protein [Streptosporangiaceae bacterium]